MFLLSLASTSSTIIRTNCNYAVTMCILPNKYELIELPYPRQVDIVTPV
jgi:hypothetical protein